jgi:hypothetical protein
MVSSGLLRSVALVRTDVSEEPGAAFIRVTKIGALGTTQAATSNRRTLRTSVASYCQHCSQLTDCCHHDDLGAMFLRNVVTSQNTAFFIFTALKTSNLTWN